MTINTLASPFLYAKHYQHQELLFLNRHDRQFNNKIQLLYNRAETARKAFAKYNRIIILNKKLELKRVYVMLNSLFEETS